MPPRRSTRKAPEGYGEDAEAAAAGAATAAPPTGGGGGFDGGDGIEQRFNAAADNSNNAVDDDDSALDLAVSTLNDAKMATTAEAKVRNNRKQREKQFFSLVSQCLKHHRRRFDKSI